MAITIKVAIVPGPVSEYVLNDSATVRDALALANVTVESGYSLKVNGAPASLSDRLSHGSTVLVSKEAKSATK